MHKPNVTRMSRLKVLESGKISKHGKSEKGNANAKPREGKKINGKRGSKPKVKIKLLEAEDESSSGSAVLE